MYGDLGDGIKWLFFIGFVSIPFGLWKLVEILVWFFHHIHWN